MQDTPLISFIVPVYNLPVTLIQECLQSIISLPMSDEEREIILVDDGSDKSPIADISEYADQIIYLRQKNSGLSVARNRGIEVSRGKYIQFVDGDDHLLPAYSHCLQIIRQDSEADVVMFSHTRKTGQPAEVINDSQPQTGTTFMRHHNLRGSACGYVFKRNLLGELRFRKGTFHEDEEFTPLLIIRSEHLINSDVEAYFYRTRSQSIIQNTDSQHVVRRLDDMEKIILRLNLLAEHRPVDERTALMRRVHQLTMDYIYNIIVNTQSEPVLNERLERLRKKGLFPLPAADYTQKYKWFSRLSSTAMGRKLLMKSLPHMKSLQR